MSPESEDVWSMPRDRIETAMCRLDKAVGRPELGRSLEAREEELIALLGVSKLGLAWIQENYLEIFRIAAATLQAAHQFSVEEIPSEEKLRIVRNAFTSSLFIPIPPDGTQLGELLLRVRTAARNQC